MDSVRSYLLCIVAACMIAAMGRVFVRSNMISKVLRLTSGILILLVAAAPLLRLKSEDFPRLFEKIDTEQFLKEDAELYAQNALSEQVRKSFERQIESVAEKFGCSVRAEVQVSSEKVPQILGVEIIGSAGPEQIADLSEYITEILGVPPEDQEWRLYETDG